MGGVDLVGLCVVELGADWGTICGFWPCCGDDDGGTGLKVRSIRTWYSISRFFCSLS
jgi:hypothetical protein